MSTNATDEKPRVRADLSDAWIQAIAQQAKPGGHTRAEGRPSLATGQEVFAFDTSTDRQAEAHVGAVTDSGLVYLWVELDDIQQVPSMQAWLDAADELNRVRGISVIPQQFPKEGE